MTKAGDAILFSTYRDNFFYELSQVKGHRNGSEEDFEAIVAQIISEIDQARINKRNVFIIGNGASATMASHVAVDFWKNHKIRAFLFSDAASLTAVGNDICFTQSFSEPLELYGNPDDLLISISSSGNSENIVNGIEMAHKKKLITISLTGMKESNKAHTLSHYGLYHPGQTYGSVESAHALILHYIIDSL